MSAARDEIGADEAVSDLFASHYRALVRLAVLLTRDQEAAEDVVQDAYVALHARWGRLRDHERALAYLRTSVVNGSRSVQRHRGVMSRTRVQPSPDEVGADVAVQAADQRARVLAALAELPRRQREVLALRHYLELSEHEIAETLGISRGSVKTHASRGAAALRTRLEELR